MNLSLLFVFISFATPFSPSAQSTSVIGSKLLIEAERELAAVKSTSYEHQIEVDEKQGIYKYDCSGFLDYAIQKIAPAAFKELPLSGPENTKPRPHANDFYAHFKNLNTKPSTYWLPVPRATDLKPGDLIAWLKPEDNHTTNTGHTMLVREYPKANPKLKSELLIRVIDASHSIHSDDTREPGHSGLGSGVVGILINEKGEPVQYRWRGGVSEKRVSTPIVFARLRDRL